MGSTCNELPFEIKTMEMEKNKKLLEAFTGELKGFVQIGPKGYFLPLAYKDEARNIYNMAVKPNDLFVMAYSRSGSTLTKEIAWMLANNLDYAKSESLDQGERFLHLEIQLFYCSEILNRLKKASENNKSHLAVLERFSQSISTVALAPSPRFIQTHLPLSLLPPSLVDTARVIYVARDPRDVAVSSFYVWQLGRCYTTERDFKDYWKLFIEDTVYFSPYFDHLKEAWKLRHHPNMLFLFYEDMNKDLPAAVRRVAKFLDKEYSEEQIRCLCEHLSIDNFRKNKMCNNDILCEIGIWRRDGEPFIRKGKAGGWREYFDEEMQAQAQAWIADNLRGSDFRFPHIPDIDAIGEST